MERFLKHLARHLLTSFEDEISKLWIIFPNRRSGLYFKHYLSEYTRKAIWTPCCLTIDELMQRLSHLQVADHLFLNIELFETFKKITRSTEEFDEFFPWGEILLTDFNDIDKYLVDAGRLFSNLMAVKEIDSKFEDIDPVQADTIRQFWSTFNGERLSGDQQQFISLWNVLHEIYTVFRESLVSKGLAYNGMIYRNVAERIRSGEKVPVEAPAVILAGFNALSTSEHVLFSFLRDEGKARFYWDYDKFYLENTGHEAGYFLRKNLERYPETDTGLQRDALSGRTETMHIVAASSRVAQAKYAGRLLEEIHASSPSGPDSTFVVLPDESLLLPVLNSLPSSLPEANITMGYPLKDTPVRTLMEILVDLYLNARRTDGRITAFFARDILRLLNHQYILASGMNGMGSLAEMIEASGNLFVTPAYLEDLPLLKELMTVPEGSEGFAALMQDILYRLFVHFSSASQPEQRLHREFIFRGYMMIERLSNILLDKKMSMKLETWLRLIRKYVDHDRITLEGEPLAGIQVLGILETRLLDAENVIILSMNEGIWPRVTHTPSFIPYNLRNGFGLPALEHQDSIYSYYFYRLLQRPANVWMLYNSQEQGMQSGEESRYIKQLVYELKYPVRQHVLAFDVLKQTDKSIRVEKSEAIFDKLRQYTDHDRWKHVLSPSAINTYLNCSLRFYFAYIAGIEEAAGLADEMDPRSFGNILHHTMYMIYRDFIGHTVNRSSIEALMKDEESIQQMVWNSFAKEYSLRDTGERRAAPEGHHRIAGEVIARYVREILGQDTGQTPFTILGLEKSMHVSIPLKSAGNYSQVFIGGTIDRIDRTGESVRIIDYKTGKPQRTFSNLDALFNKGDDKRNEAALQTLIYAMIWLGNNGDDQPVMPGIYWVRGVMTEEFDPHLYMEKQPLADARSLMHELSSLLTGTVSEIFDQTVPFIQVEQTDICNYCPYKRICHR